MNLHSGARAAALSQRLQGQSVSQAIASLTRLFPGGVVFSTSFGTEDQVITHHIAAHQLPVQLFTLDTGRLFPETYATWASTLASYPVSIRSYAPDAEALQAYVTEHGPDAFYQSPELRKACCAVRKVEPLQKALQGFEVWITGVRAEHSPTRNDLQLVEWDEGNQIFKFNPLLHWTTEEVMAYLKQHHVPYNPLTEKGFVSIGCQPCTRAIRPGEDFRAGRWWWEDNSKKECGLHVRQS
jgi:phosphoadenosine phosphosulfate reductase